MQNNLHELWALLNYLHPSIFTVTEPFDDAFELGSESINIDRKTLDSVHHLLRPLMLRRLKTEVRLVLHYNIFLVALYVFYFILKTHKS